MTRHRSWLQIWALLGAALLAVHEGRYLLGYGSHAQEALARQGHAYLAFVAPLVAVSIAGVLASLIVRAAGRGGSSRSRSWSTTRLAGACGVAILVLYVGQETLEGLLSSGHPSGPAGVFGAGGWTAVPLSAIAGVILALAVRIARDESGLGVTAEVRPLVRASLASRTRPAGPRAQRHSPLARVGAQRAPPVTV